jgi:hypothetical protein
MEVQDSARAGDPLQSAIKNIAIGNKAEYFGITVPHIKTVLGLTGVATQLSLRGGQSARKCSTGYYAAFHTSNTGL